MKQVDYAVSKLRSMRRLIESVRSDELTHSHAEPVLAHIQQMFEEREQKLNSIHPDSDRSVANALCKESLFKVSVLFPLVGFIARSIDVRNSFEVHGPFLSVIRKALGKDAKLILSSEWEFSPFTYVMPADLGLNNVVFIGYPASEANNCLVIPLSGHELGHNVWRANAYASRYSRKVEEKLLALIEKDWESFERFFPDVGDKNNIGDLITRQYWLDAWKWAMSQCEETYCDFLGLLLFGESYLEAFAYLLAPGLHGTRSPYYLNLSGRVEALTSAAKDIGVPVPKEYSDLFEDSELPQDSRINFLMELSDKTTRALISQILIDARDFVNSKGLLFGTENDAEKVVKCFAVGVPATAPANLSCIINAAWKFFRQNMSPWEKSYPNVYSDNDRSKQMLDDLVFKSIEVLEINQIQAAN